jgi:hypothetical protein
MPATDLRAITDFDSLRDFLEDELDWNLSGYSFEDLTFSYQAEELGLKPEEAAGVRAIHQLRPLSGRQPWGIFFVEFESKRLPVVVMRRILSALVLRKRASANQSERAAFASDDLLFITRFGTAAEPEIAFAHFHQENARTLPVLRVLGWDGQDTPLKLERVAHILRERLAWPEDDSDHAAWRDQWAGAFRHRIGHVIRTSDLLATELAALARRVRDAATAIMARETNKGPLTRLFLAFKEALLHDLTPETFADTYAQTISYGLFTAAISRTVPGEGKQGTYLSAIHVADLVPVTSPFLKEMLATFLEVGGKKGGLDFDELGIQSIVDLFTGEETDMDAILSDFGNKTRGEDPVIHFYEHFLTAYNKALKIQRGVFYTPQPVVSYIVRSAHELLQTEFGLEHGLADTTTWGEMLKKFPSLQLPPLTDEPGCKETISPDEFFVQILDPATGTATFPVEIIDLIFHYLKALWEKRGPAAMPRFPLPENCKLLTENFTAWWNCYVPHALLPRLHAFELMMAPYAIAHMKIGLKLAETGYQFQSNERARIYLTNALEETDDKQAKLIGFDALAHEAAAVNEIKRHKRFTVVIGNPPYSLLSANLEPHHRALVEDYKFVNGIRIHERSALQLEKNLNDDYVKFVRLTQLTIERAGVGVSGLITNHSFLDNPTMRGLRWSLLRSASRIWLNDLHGNSTKQEQPPDGGEDMNVFQIKQGVAIALSVRLPGTVVACEAKHHERWGTRQSKEAWLGANHFGSHEWLPLAPTPDFFLFVPQNSSLKSEFEAWPSLPDVLPTNGAGYITARDNLVIDFERDAVVKRVCAFNASRQDDASLLKTFEVADKRGWDVRRARAELKHIDISQRVIKTNYRPFDSRWIFFDSTLVWGRSWPTMQHVVGYPENLTFLATRMTKDQWDVWVARTVSSHKAMSAYDTNSIFPLYLADDSESSQQSFPDEQRINLAASFLKSLAKILGLQPKGQYSLPVGLAPEDIFHYIYAIFHSPGYRTRYAEFLKIDFPRLPLTSSLDLFRALARLGGELTALHLLESPKLDTPITEFSGGAREIAKVGWTPDHGGTVWIDAGGKKAATTPGTTGFRGVPEAVWNFHIGGYQVCEKWLKDRKGRTLTDDDIAHYHKIVVALSETIRLMAEIDEVINQHGGWPSAFATKVD